MQKLVRGIHHFQKNVFRSERAMFERLARGQHPDTLFITCSDSRVNPNLLTGTHPGELFILRNAGNIVPPSGAPLNGEAATVEYAVAVLEVEDIIVCGHSHCGAIGALLDPSSTAELPAMRAWLDYAEETRQIVTKCYADLEGEPLLTAAIEENVLVQIENLRTMPAVAARLAKGDLGLHGWVYKIETGEVFAYDTDAEQFFALTEELVGPASTAARSIAPIHSI
ncbi:MAG: carbonic anhydrase [Myxococcales bacterium]|nr:carbonic anhydrase [Myxococcales bacterium]